VAGEQAVGEASFTFFIFTFCTVREPTTNVRLHGWPVIVARKRGMDFRVGEVVEIGVMLAGKGFAEGRRDQDARGEVGIPVDVKAVARGERIGVDGIQAGGVGELGIFPFVKGRW
jgi:hypothetical protein